MRQQIKHILAILLFVLGTASLQAQSVDVQLVYNNTADVDASLSNLVKVDELKEAIQANGHIDQNLIVRIAFFDKNVVGQMMLNAEHKLSIDDYVSKWQKMVENKNAVLFLFVKQYENDTYEFNKMHLSGKLSKHFLSSVIELIDKQLTGDNNEIIAKGTHYLAEAIKFILTKEKMEQATMLTPFEIKICREYIKTLSDEGEKAKWYLKLQEKVPYHNQRDNESLATDEDLKRNSWLKDGSTAGDIMCNLTSESMCLEMLGVEFPCVDCDSDCDKYKQFEDYLECLRLSNGYEDRTKCATHEKLSKLFNVKCLYKDITSNERTKIDSILGNALREGKSVLLSTFGHQVRLQAITDKGLIVDDPYGKVYDFSKSGCTPKYYIQKKYDQRNGNNWGNNNLWEWSILQTNNIIINYAEIYSTND